jgi:hypothetical protein
MVYVWVYHTYNVIYLGYPLLWYTQISKHTILILQPRSMKRLTRWLAGTGSPSLRTTSRCPTQRQWFMSPWDTEACLLWAWHAWSPRTPDFGVSSYLRCCPALLKGIVSQLPRTLACSLS